jgi:hypothetical protein
MTNTHLLRPPTALRRFLALVVLVLATMGFSTTRAQAAGESLSLVQNDPNAVVGRATNFTASGTLNPDDTMFGFDIFIFLKDADADPTCAADFDGESATAMHSGGNESWVSPGSGFQVGMGPAFDQPFKITFTGPGHYLLCGYVNGDFSTFATGELRGVVAGAPTVTTPQVTTRPSTPAATTPATTPASGSTPTSAVPVAARAPWITRKHHALTCHPGTWANRPTSLSYLWYVKGSGKRVASRRKLIVRHSLKGRKVACRVTARNAAGHGTAASRPVRAR